MPKIDSSLIPFLSTLAIVLGILSLFVPMYWDLGNRVSRLEGAFSVAEPLIVKGTITQTVVVKTVTLTTASVTSTSSLVVLATTWSDALAMMAIVAGFAGLVLAIMVGFARRKDPDSLT